MKIAFDVKGTLDGPKGVTIRYILSQLQQQGHEITVWSNCYSYATDIVAKYKMKDVAARDKFSKGDVDNEKEKFFDVAFEDDRSQSYLAAKRMIFVDQVPEDSEGIAKLIESIKE